MQHTSPPMQQASTFRLSPQQRFLFGLDWPQPVSQCAVLVEAAPPDAALRAVVEELAQRHEILRTTYPTPTGARLPVGQTIHDQLAPDWVSESRSDRELLEDPSALEALMCSEAAAQSEPGDRGPLRVRAVRVPVGRCLLVLTALAACADAPSLLAIAEQLAGSVAPAASEPIQHADYAEWRTELIAGDDPEAIRGREFWQRAAEVAGPVSPPLFGRGTGEALRETPIRLPVALGTAEADALRAAARESRADPELFALAAWSVLLGRLSGTSEVLVAALADGRGQPDLDCAIGPYSQPIPVRVRLEGQTRFVEVIDQVRRARVEAYRLQDYGSESELRLLVNRAAGGFSSLRTESAGALLSIRSAVEPSPIGLAWQSDGSGELWADPAVYERRDTEDVAARLRTLLVAAAADPAELVSRLPLLDENARSHVLALGVGPYAPVADICIHHSFEDQVRRTPDLPAVAGAGEELTFAELNRCANQIARHLLELGAGPEAPVGLCVTRSPSMLASVLGILKSGSAYLPLNFSHPPERIAHQLAEAGTRILLTETALLTRLPPLAAPNIVCIDGDASKIAARPEDNPPRVSDSGDVAYVMYTSGSTGTPKGVAVTHGNLAAYTAGIAEKLEAGDGVQFAVVSEISTDLGNTAIFPPLTTGGCVHLIDPEMAMDGTALARYAREHPIDVMKITPTHLRTLLTASDGVLPRRCLVLGGEVLSWDLVRLVQGTGSRCRILNHYGPTETTVGCCAFETTEEEGQSSAASVPIGRPLSGVRAYILDRHLEPVPVGVVGELCIGGVGVARGYLHRADETAARFVPEVDGVFGGGGQMYRTGDRARFLPDGSIEFIGRVDDQVKIRGFRVEPGEVEATIRRHPAVREAVVIARENGAAELMLIAYVVASSEPPAGELQEFVGHSLPEHMVPSRFVSIDSLPLTGSGKVDRLALPDPATVQSGRSAAFVAPRDELEQEIAVIWSELLGVSEVGVLDDFFALGGHSLMATQVIMRVRRVHGDIPLGALFNSPTIAALAEVIRATTAPR